VPRRCRRRLHPRRTVHVRVERRAGARRRRVQRRRHRHPALARTPGAPDSGMGRRRTAEAGGVGSALAESTARVTKTVAPRDVGDLRRFAWLLDDVIRIPGTNIRFGIDPLIGLLPGGGDLAAGALSTYIILAAARAGAPPVVLLRMG